jgi:hypothetical protein
MLVVNLPQVENRSLTLTVMDHDDGVLDSDDDLLGIGQKSRLAPPCSTRHVD